MSTTTQRRYDIDWLRVICIFLLIIYHISIGYQPWGLMVGFIQNENPLGSIWLFMAFLNVWRIPILFFIAGMGVFFSLKNRNWQALIKERMVRIVLPYLFGIVAIVPIHVLLLQKYYDQHLTYHPSAGHLWFLGNIALYTGLLLPLFLYLKKSRHQKLGRQIETFFGSMWCILSLVIAFILESILIKPVSFEVYAMTWHGFAIGMISFIYGYLFVYSGSVFWAMINKWNKYFLATGIFLYTVRLVFYKLEAPSVLVSIESVVWVLVLFSAANKYWNRPSATLSYLNQCSYPVYIIHMIVLYGVSAIVFPTSIPVILKYIISIIATLLLCLSCFEFIIKSNRVLRPLFGLKTRFIAGPFAFRKKTPKA